MRTSHKFPKPINLQEPLWIYGRWLDDDDDKIYKKLNIDLLQQKHVDVTNYNV